MMYEYQVSNASTSELEIEVCNEVSCDSAFVLAPEYHSLRNFIFDFFRGLRRLSNFLWKTGKFQENPRF
jgi:hypothetical protein